MPSPTRQHAAAFLAAAAGIALSVAAIGCVPGDDLSGAAIPATAPPATGAALAEGRGTPTGIGGTVWREGGATDAPGSLELVLWEDIDRDGSCDPTTDATRDTTSIGSDGSYFFAIDVPGNYCVQVGGGLVPAGWTSSMSEPVQAGATGATLDIDLP